MPRDSWHYLLGPASSVRKDAIFRFLGPTIDVINQRALWWWTKQQVKHIDAVSSWHRAVWLFPENWPRRISATTCGFRRLRDELHTVSYQLPPHRDCELRRFYSERKLATSWPIRISNRKVAGVTSARLQLVPFGSSVVYLVLGRRCSVMRRSRDTNSDTSLPSLICWSIPYHRDDGAAQSQFLNNSLSVWKSIPSGNLSSEKRRAYQPLLCCVLCVVRLRSGLDSAGSTKIISRSGKWEQAQWALFCTGYSAKASVVRHPPPSELSLPSQSMVLGTVLTRPARIRGNARVER